MKTCSDCKQDKPIEDFQRWAKSKDGHTNKCKPCKRKYDNNYYSENKNRREYIKANRKESKDRVSAYILSYLQDHPCVDCGEHDPIVLEFDHVRGIKVKAVVELRNSSLLAVQKEIEKCEVRCANCHRRKTAKQLKYLNKVRQSG